MQYNTIFLSKSSVHGRHHLQVHKAPEGSHQKIKAQKDLSDAMAHRKHVDDSMKLIGNLLFGAKKGPRLLKAVRPAGQPLVDDWTCLKSMVLKSLYSQAKQFPDQKLK